MKPVLPLFIMIDACGWEIIRNDGFARKVAPHRHRLASVFGYSSTCVPSIVSGCWPVEHRNWCYFVYDPVRSPFQFLRPLQWLPSAVTSRRRFRRWLSAWVKKRLGLRGYFDLYNIPFRYIHLYDFTEKKSPLRPEGMNRGSNIFDFLTKRHIPYVASNPDTSEEANRDALIAAIETEVPDFAFNYWPGLDGLLHRVGNDSPEIPARLRMYESWIDQVLAAARRHYKEVHLYLFSDHGMANCNVHIDLRKVIEALPIEMERDYAVVYDSTMARFWFFNDRARRLITEALGQVPEGRIVPDAELEEMQTFFQDRYFGELIFLVREGTLIVPSHMGERPIRAMHGYHPSEPQSFAALLTNQPDVPGDVVALPDLFRLMTHEAERAKTENHPSRAPAPDQPTVSV